MCNRAAEFNNAVKLYGSTKALNGLSLEVAEGDIFALVGLNGAGKTTAIKTMVGLSRLSSGSIKLNSVRHCSDLGFAPEFPDIPDFYTVEELLLHSLSFFKGKNSIFNSIELCRQYAEEAISLFGLNDLKKNKISSLSKGNRQRAALAAAAVHKPKLLILDEPAGGLDPIGRTHLKEIFSILNKNGTTIIFSTHILSDIADLCTNMGVIHKGKIIFNGSPSEFCGNNDLSRINSVFIDRINEAEKSGAISCEKINGENLPEAEANKAAPEKLGSSFHEIKAIASEIFIKNLRNNMLWGSVLLMLPFLYGAWISEQSNPGYQTGFIADTGTVLIGLFAFIFTFIQVLEHIKTKDSTKKDYFILSRIKIENYPSGIFLGIISAAFPAIMALCLILTVFIYFTSGSLIFYPIKAGMVISAETAVSVAFFSLLAVFLKKIPAISIFILSFILCDSIAQFYDLNIFTQISGILLPDFSIFVPELNAYGILMSVGYGICQSLFYLIPAGFFIKKQEL